MIGFEGIGDFGSNDPWQRFIAHEAAKGNLRSEPKEAPRCPNCDRVMSNREHDEQGQCNDCLDGTIPRQV